MDGMFGAQWSEWLQKGWFDIIEKQIGNNPDDTCEDGGAYIGLMRDKCGEPFQYWIGMFVPITTNTPEGFDSVTFPQSDWGICWVYGKEPDVYMKEGKCREYLKQNGMEDALDQEGARWFFERYACPRFTAPDEKGNIILDIGFFVQ